MKVCSHCKIEKELFLFGKNKSIADGIHTWCKDCSNNYRKKYYSENRVVEIKKAQEFRNNNPDKVKSINKKSYLKNRDAQLDRMRDYQLRNKEIVKAKRDANKEKLREYNAKLYLDNRETMLAKRKEWKNKNPEKVTATTAKRRAMKLNATPKWLTKEQHKEITLFYKKAKEMTKLTGEVYEVDHIFPLVSDIGCGLHVPCNLQVIPARENRFKNNKIFINAIV